MPLLEIKNLVTAFHTPQGRVPAVDGVSLSIERGGMLGLVGESGCGKSVTAMSVLRLVAAPGRIESGQILLESAGAALDLATLPEPHLRHIRGARIGMIFQEPMTSLNPVFTIGDQVAEVVRLHRRASREAARARALEMLRLVRLADPERRLDEYPHQLSGGMRQRVMIAMALACDPDLVIADEPTTALDVTIQAQILELMQEMKERFGMAIMLITHAMGVVAETCQRVTVMYAGNVVEEASVEALFGDPRHPYTQGLIRSIPRVDRSAEKKQRLEAIAGTVPNLLDPPPGCRFAARCKFAMDVCSQGLPPLKEVGPGHYVRCVL
jgi:peptide/nickel transport system ATP-binding protein